MAARKPTATTRDRSATEQAILTAAKEVLAEDGFTAFGINAIARKAGCDKQLIYRYFGGLDGLVDAIGKDLSDLFAELLAEPESGDCSNYAEFVEHLLLALLQAFRSSDLLLRIAAWEVIDPSAMTKRLAKVRGAVLGEWINERRGNLVIPTGTDTGAINATLIAAVQHLALSARAVGSFGGVALETDEDWARIRRALSAMVASAYSDEGHTVL